MLKKDYMQILAVHQQRYEKVRQLCRNLNRKRRNLRDKVDLLCKDLIGSNRQFALTLGDLRLLCDFQYELIGENDMGCLLHKALQLLTAQLEQTSSAVYLCTTRSFEAHLCANWQDENDNLAQIESVLQEVVIDVCRKGTVINTSAQTESDSESSAYATPFAILGLPVIVNEQLVAVAVFYRDSSESFVAKEQIRLQSCLPSLGRQILALLRLHTFLGDAHSQVS